MKISELRANQDKVDLDVEVLSVSPEKSFTKFGRTIRVANARIRDDSGEGSLTLWNQEIEQVRPNARVKVTNGFVREFQGELTVTSGKFGKLEVIDGAEGEGTKAPEEDEEVEEAEEVEEVEETEEA